MYYVYEWFRMDLNLPYYIGKGKGRRAFGLSRTTKHTNNVTQYLIKNGIKRDVRIIAYFKSEEAAFAYEKERISFWWYLKEHGILTNQTLGGEGTSGRRMSDEQKKNLGDCVRGDKNCMKREDVKERNRAAQLVSQNRPDVIKKKSDALKLKGDRHSSKDPVVKDKISKSLIIHFTSNGHHSTGHKASEKTKEKLSASVQAAREKETPEQKAQRGQRIWETRRANGTDKIPNTHSRKKINIFGIEFESQKSLAEYLNVSQSYITKCVKNDNIYALEYKVAEILNDTKGRKQ
jgi:hypothetical protein